MRHATSHPGVYYGWVIVATTFWMAVCTGGGRSGFGVFVIPMTEELGWNRSTISLAAALGALSSGLRQPLVGRFYRRWQPIVSEGATWADTKLCHRGSQGRAESSILQHQRGHGPRYSATERNAACQ